MSLTDSIAGVAGKVASVRGVSILGAVALAASCLAGWALWSLAGAGARCDTRLADARMAGDRAVSGLAAAQQVALDTLRTEQDAELIRAWAAHPLVVERETTRWRPRWRNAGPIPGCALTPGQVEAINAAIRSGGTP
jgi:hypothetical protein